MEHKVEVLGVDGDLVGDLVLLVVEEVFQDLLLLDLVIPLADKALSTTCIVIAQDSSLHDLLKHEFVSLVSDLVVDLAEVKPGQQGAEHLIASSLEHPSELALRSLLKTFQDVEEARMDAGLETVELNLLAFHLDVPVQSAEVSSEKVHTGAEVPDRDGGARVHTLHIFSEPGRGEDAHEPDQLPIEVVKGKSQHLQVLKGLALQEGLGEKGRVDLLVEHSVREDSRSHFDDAFVSWSSL